MIYEISVIARDGSNHTFKVELGGNGAVQVNGRMFAVDANLQEREVLSLIIDGRSYEARRDGANGEMQLEINNQPFRVEVRDPRSLRGRRDRAGGAEGAKKIIAPMPGKVVRVIAPVGSAVEAGQGVIVIEAMKMQNELKAPKAGKVTRLSATEGAAVNAGDVLAVVE